MFFSPQFDDWSLFYSSGGRHAIFLYEIFAFIGRFAEGL